jgi:hypothetical protein
MFILAEITCNERLSFACLYGKQHCYATSKFSNL